LAIDPRLADGHGCLGMVLNGIGQNDKAAEQFATALKLEPTNDIFYIGLAAAYEKLSRPADAEQTYKRAIDARPHYWAAYNTLGGYYYRLGRHDDAIAMYRQVVDLVPDSFRGYSNLGAAYFMKSQTAEAIAAFERSLAIRPNYQAASNLGTLYYFEGQYRRSAEAFRQALKLNEANYQVWVNLADALQWAGDPDGSRQTYKRARELAAERARVNARDAAIQMALASSEAALGEKQNALASLDKAISLEPDDAHTLFQIAVFLEYRAGRRDEALTWLSKAVARGQTWIEIDRAPALRELRKDPRFQKLRQ
jgi:tetratricopeptide (TPR) repeat protein